MRQDYFRAAGRCPVFESVRSAKGIEIGNVHSRDLVPRCDHCSYWVGGRCELFLSRG